MNVCMTVEYQANVHTQIIYSHLKSGNNVWKVHQQAVRTKGQLKEDASNVHGNSGSLNFFHSKV